MSTVDEPISGRAESFKPQLIRQSGGKTQVKPEKGPDLV